MLARIKGWFGKNPEQRPSIGGVPISDELWQADQRARGVTSSVVPETITSASLPRDRFKVQRIEDGVTYEAYSGDDGVEALEAWEAYQGSEKLGVFTFMDGATCRGSFAR